MDVDTALHNLVVASRVDPQLRAWVQVVEDHLDLLRRRGAYIARMGCPRCADAAIEPPVACCVLCGQSYYDAGSNQ